MNCRNCGAPMEFRPQRKHFFCRYCTTFAFPNQDANRADGIILHGETVDLPCPSCQTPLQSASVEGAEARYCDQCRGVLLRNEDFGLVVKRRRAESKRPASEPLPIDPRELDRNLRCPCCQRPMDTHPYYGPGNVVVDTCATCAVIWLDHGELTMIETAPGRGRPADLD